MKLSTFTKSKKRQLSYGEKIFYSTVVSKEKLSLRKRLSVRFKKKKSTSIRHSILYYHPLEDGNETNHLTSTNVVDSTYTEEEKRGKVKRGKVKLEVETISPPKDTNNMIACSELFCEEDASPITSDTLTMEPTSGEMKSSQIASTIDHQENHYISIYDTLEFSFFDNEVTEDNETTSTATVTTPIAIKQTHALETITEESRQQASSWMNAPSLTESESDEESVIDEDTSTGERSLINNNVTHIAQNTLTKDSKSTRKLVSNVTPPSIRNERLLMNMKLSSTLAYNRKEVLIRKRKSLVQSRRRIRSIIRLMLAACVVYIILQTWWTTVQSASPKVAILDTVHFLDEMTSYEWAQGNIVSTNSAINVCPLVEAQ